MRVFALIAACFALPGLSLAADGSVGPDEAVAAWEADKSIIFSAEQVNLDDFQWIARPLIVFANTPRDPDFATQLEFLSRDVLNLVERDVVIITDSDPDAASDIRTKLRPRGFQLTLIGKDGGVKLRKPAPWSVREISRSIDKMPMRQQEVRDRLATGTGG
ncbi:MAG: DUF4174 domain-containing protein [Rhodobacteraceae bacterium]|nr:DUF4174 domain-containing protein [Paracoccaceae bacterium]